MKLKESVNATRLDLQRLHNKENRVHEKERRLFKAQSVAASRLSYLKRVSKKLYSKEHSLQEQGV